MKAGENETVADVVKRVRRECNSYPLPTASAEMLKLVREIYAAHGREIAELRECLKEAIDMTCDNNGSCDDCPLFWNHNDCKVARWRKALEGSNHELH